MSRFVHYVAYDPKFIPQQISFLTRQFSDVDQVFFVQGAPESYLKSAPGAVRKLSAWTLPEFIRQGMLAKRVFINGLYDPRLPFFLFPFPSIARKSIWLPWGGDLYWDQFQSPGVRTDILMWFRRGFVRNLGGIATMLRADYDLVKTWYDTNARHIEAGPNIFAFETNDLERIRADRKSTNHFAIQVGNSGDPSNEHLEVFEWLARYRERDIHIYAPLAYGDSDYIEAVIERGSGLFGAKFTALTKLLPFEEYNRYLASLDAVVLNHRRPQGFGNASIALYLGAKVFVRREVTMWKYLSEEIGCRIFDATVIGNMSYEEFTGLDDQDRETSKRKITVLFDRDWQKKMWSRIYSE